MKETNNTNITSTDTNTTIFKPLKPKTNKKIITKKIKSNVKNMKTLIDHVDKTDILDSKFFTINALNVGLKRVAKQIKIDEKEIPDKYTIKCGISGEILENPRYTYISNQKNGSSEYVHEKHLSRLNSCCSCKRLFLEVLEENYCVYCIQRAVDKHILSYNTRAENKLDCFFSPKDPKNNFCDKNISAFYQGRNPNSFVYNSGGLEPRPNLFGIELEYECGKSRGLAVLKVHPLVEKFAVLKRDSTLAEGFEIVSAPADKLSHYHLWDELFKLIETDENIKCTPYHFDEEKGKGVGCGLHIHISKDSMIHHNSYGIEDKNGRVKDLSIVTGLSVAKLQTFIYSSSNRKFVQLMAGRESNMYNDFTKEKGIIIDNKGRIIKGAGSVINLAHGGFDHRTAVNFNSSNGKTIEFRIFRSTKNRFELLKNIDFVDAICCFCRTGNASLLEMKNWIYFYEFVCKNRQDYPYLYKFFEKDSDFLTLLSNKEKGIEENEDAQKNIKGGKIDEVISMPYANLHPIGLFDELLVREQPQELKLPLVPKSAVPTPPTFQKMKKAKMYYNNDDTDDNDDSERF